MRSMVAFTVGVFSSCPIPDLHPVLLAVPDWAIPSLYSGITIAPFVFVIESQASVCSLMRHEKEHVAQVARSGWLPFYSRYLYEFVRNYVRSGDWQFSYASISFEVDARKVQQEGSNETC